MKIMLIDESGDSNLDSLDPYYPIFVLGGVIIDTEDLLEVEKAVNDFKIKYWGTTKVILHTREIVRKEPPYDFLFVKEKRDEFYNDINLLIQKVPFSVTSCIIDKRLHKEKYGNNAVDAYELSLNVLVERFIYSLDRNETGVIKAEARGKIADREIELVCEKVKNSGTRYVLGSEVSKKIDGFSIHDKKENIVGMQLADLIVSPLGRQYLGKPPKEDIHIIEEKLVKNKKGEFEGYGRVILPK